MRKPFMAIGIACGVSLGTDRALAPTLPAQEHGRGHFVIGVGWGSPFILDLGANSPDGPMVAVAAGWSLGRHFMIEGSVDRNHYRDGSTGLRGEATAVLGRVAYRFGPAHSIFRRRRIELVRDTSISVFTFRGETTQRRTRHDFAATMVGTGVDMFVTRRFFVRPEASVIFREYAFLRVFRLRHSLLRHYPMDTRIRTHTQRRPD